MIQNEKELRDVPPGAPVVLTGVREWGAKTLCVRSCVSVCAMASAGVRWSVRFVRCPSTLLLAAYQQFIRHS
eukprot:scaffold53803_cov52-Attheya_sp.AAC.1